MHGFIFYCGFEERKKAKKKQPSVNLCENIGREKFLFFFLLRLVLTTIIIILYFRSSHSTDGFSLIAKDLWACVEFVINQFDFVVCRQIDDCFVCKRNRFPHHHSYALFLSRSNFYLHNKCQNVSHHQEINKTTG